MLEKLEASFRTITYNETGKKDDLFIKVPDNGRVKEVSGESAVYDNDNYARNAEFVKATPLTELRFDFPTFYDGDQITTDFKVTSVPAGAVKSDKFVNEIKADEKAGILYQYYASSPDNKKETFSALTKDDKEYTVGKYYGTIIPSSVMV